MMVLNRYAIVLSEGEKKRGISWESIEKELKRLAVENETLKRRVVELKEQNEDLECENAALKNALNIICTK